MRNRFVIQSLFLVFIYSILTFISSVHAQENAEALFINNSDYDQNIEEKVLQAIKIQGGKTITELQNAARTLKNEEGFTWKKIKPNPSQGKKAEQVFNERKSAVFIMGKLNKSSTDAEPTAGLYATAFGISEDGICVTNYHVLSELIYLTKTNDSIAAKTNLGTYFIQTVDGEVFVLDKLLAFSSSNDLALFKVKTAGKPLPFIPLGKVLKVGEPVYIISHPDHNYYYFSKGIVNKNSLMLNPRKPNIRQYRINVDADYAVGSSGGPILSETGDLAGIVSSTQSIPWQSEALNKLQMVLKNAISVHALYQLLK